jgi:predicted nucleotidyltransferase
LRVITPTYDGAVLAVLALADEEFTVGQLSRLVEASASGVRKVVRRLVAQGIVTAKDHGPLSVYRLNRQHLAAESVLALAGLKGRLLTEIEDALAAWLPAPTYAAVFGSAARGEMSETSDIDVLLVRPKEVEDESWDRQVDAFSTQVRAWTGNDVRVVSFDIEDVRVGDALLENVLADGLTVSGSATWLRRQLQRK